MDYKEFLDKIRMIESSGGIDTDHKEMDSGIHKGSSAYGQYGLMPNTIREMSTRLRRSKTDDQRILDLEKADDEYIKKQLQDNPELEQYYAEKLAEHIVTRQGGDLDKSAYAWNMGHNLYPEKISQDQLESHPYSKKFRNLSRTLSSK